MSHYNSILGKKAWAKIGLAVDFRDLLGCVLLVVGSRQSFSHLLCLVCSLKDNFLAYCIMVGLFL